MMMLLTNRVALGTLREVGDGWICFNVVEIIVVDQ